jgi:glycerol-3-phosphate acyltransferase PlsY
VHPLVGVLVSYLAGSIPFAYLAGKMKGVDLREHGSGNLGATNAVRVLGKGIGAFVYLGDTLKGMLPVLLLPPLLDAARPDLWAIAFGLAAIVGHIFPVFLLFQGGGKGVATSGGVFFGLAFVPTLIALISFILVVAITRRVSLGSISAAIVLPIAVIVARGVIDPLSIICIVVCLIVIWMHRSNISRIRAGTEPKIGDRKRGRAEA